jgi:hypothetical protein
MNKKVVFVAGVVSGLALLWLAKKSEKGAELAAKAGL